MTVLAIELNDAGIRVVPPQGSLVTEPACALVEDEVLAVGSEAFRAARLRPRQASDRFWTDLGLEPLPRGRGAVRTNADIAFAQLSSLWDRFGTEVREVVLVVPASFTIEQLGLLLGMAEACEMPVVGVVDSAVASSDSHPGRELLHLELGLHQAVVSRMEQSRGISRESFEVVQGVGLAPLREHWIRSITRVFVLQTRFNPLHDAHAEQALYDGLPDCLDSAARNGAARVELCIGERKYAAEVTSGDLALPDGVCTALSAGLQRLRREVSGALVQIGAHAATLPGIASALGGLPDVETRTLQADAACEGALSRLSQVRSPDKRLRLVTRLQTTGEPAQQPVTATVPSRPGDSPTHVVYQGWAHCVGNAPFTIGDPVRREAMSGPGLEVTQEHLSDGEYCCLRRAGGELLVEDPGCGVLLNGERIESRAALRVGDVVQFGSPGITLHFVALAGNDGP